MTVCFFFYQTQDDCEQQEEVTPGKKKRRKKKKNAKSKDVDAESEEPASYQEPPKIEVIWGFSSISALWGHLSIDTIENWNERSM